jgi:HD-GYP domain-containing protein (c-di-GMP phosphodiesterase class II)
MSATVPVSDLRVGMFVHLDLGWMRHPFALSSFRIASPDQIETIRRLGVAQLRWDPEKSDLASDVAPSVAGDPPPRRADAGDTVETGAETPAQAEARRRREALARQRAAMRLLENQCSEAAQALRDATRAVTEHPAQARQDGEALSRALLDKLLVDGDMCIRLVNGPQGDRAAAHGLNVAVVSLLMGRALRLDEAEMMDLGVGALFHDVGKLELPDRVHHFEDAFTPAEVQAYREHVTHGIRLGQRMGLGAGALAVLAQHHEHADGSGFPQRMGGDRMSLPARIVALVNRYDNLCNPALLARALTPHEALSMLFAQSRGRFDTTLLNTFIRMMGVYPVGSLVQLTDDRHALVVGVNSSRPLKPRVLVHDPRLPPEEALHLDLETQADLGVRRSIGPSKLPRAALQYLAPPTRMGCFFEPVAPHAEAAT